MAFFNRSNSAVGASGGVSPMRSWTADYPRPEDIGCDPNNIYEVTNWRNFCLKWSEYAKKVVTWNRLASDYYRAVLDNGLVIFFDAFENTIFIRDPASSAVSTEKEWRREFSRRLRRMMEFNNLDQNGLAEKTGYSQSSVCAYLGGTKLPSSYALFRLADALKCSTEFLCDFR